MRRGGSGGGRVGTQSTHCSSEARQGFVKSDKRNICRKVPTPTGLGKAATRCQKKARTAASSGLKKGALLCTTSVVPLELRSSCSSYGSSQRFTTASVYLGI